MKHLLLCGHGYLGQAVSRDFLAAGWQVTAVSRSLSLPSENGATELTADLASAESIADLASSIPAPDFVIHCASSGGGGAGAYRSVFLDGCRHLLDHFPGPPLLFTSSTSVYAQTDGSTVTEESPAEPDRETGRVLRETEDLVLAHHGIVFRLAGLYGPHRSYLLRKFLNGGAGIEDDGRRFVNQIHRDDAANAMLHAATRPLASGIWNVSDSFPRSQLHTYQGLAELFGKPLPPFVPRDPHRKRGWTHKRVSNARLLASGWKPAYPDFLEAAPSLAASV